MNYRIHTVGASGSGTTTLAKALSQELQIPHFDSDDYYWEPTNPPYTTKRSIEERVRLLSNDLDKNNSWTLSGSLVKWGEVLAPRFTHVVFIHIPPEIRLARLRAREVQKHGSRIEPGGDMHEIHRKLMDWAALYDNGGPEVRSKKLHEDWLETLSCPIIRLESAMSTAEQVAKVLSEMEQR